MADKGIANISASILPDSIKTRFSGVLSYQPAAIITASSGEGWVYLEPLATSSSTALITTGHDYLTGVSGTAVAAGDLVKWICIQHTGTRNGVVKTAEGVLIGLNHAAGYDAEEMILLEPNEIITLKVPNLEVEELLFRTCVVAAGTPTANGTNNVKLNIAAILKNVG
tara:strand:+ start:3414 stop:3917 length:504 start_codon:yes stop_codon:yes gene_type:complete